MPERVTNYQCPNCTAPLRWDPKSARLVCDWCGSSFTAGEVKDFYAAKDAAAEKKAEEERKAGAQENPGKEDARDWGAEGEGMQRFSCPSCGAEILVPPTTGATRCPYCGNPQIVPGQFAGTLKPDCIIPFKLEKKEAVKALKKHFKGKILLPKAFSSTAHIEEIQGVYVPFWLYDDTLDADCLYEATRMRTYISGEDQVKETRYYAVRRKGTLVFEGVPADASRKMDDAYMDSLEPYDWSALVPFSTAYFPGYVADIRDVSSDECGQRVHERCEASAVSVLRRDIGGYMTVRATGSRADIRSEKIRYALLPVWTLVTEWKGKKYLFMMNGQTGKMVGNLPASTGRTLGLFTGLFFISAAAIRLLLMLMGVQ